MLPSAIQRGSFNGPSPGSLGRAPDSNNAKTLGRNMRHQYRTQSRLERRSACHRTRPWDYRPSLAQRRADSMAAPGPGQPSWRHITELRDLVQAKLWVKLSPKRGSLGAPLRGVSQQPGRCGCRTQTIYQNRSSVQGRGALRRELAITLGAGRPRKPRSSRTGTPRTDTEHGQHQRQRPAEVADRGGTIWSRKVDLIMGRTASQPSAPRSSERLACRVLLHLPDRHGPLEVLRGHDRGDSEMARVHLEVLDLGPGQ